MFRLFASPYSWSLVGPRDPLCDRSPPRSYADLLSCVDVLLAVLDSPDLARSLFTVRAAISFARPVDSPRFSAPSLMCSY